MMENPTAFFRSGLRRADIHVAINLHGVRTDDFTAEFLGEMNADGRFTDPGRTADDNDFRFCGI